ncbi:hypothetical protein GCM10028792_05880 [Salinisphaera aquimarina]
MIIKPDLRGKGYGRELAQSLLDEALAHGPKTVSLNVYCDNKPAIALYNRLGFIAIERAPGDSKSDAQYVVYEISRSAAFGRVCRGDN